MVHAIEHNLLTNDHSKKQIICLNNNMIFESIISASKWCGCKRGTISDYLNSRKDLRKTAGKHPETNEGLKWMFYEDYLMLNKKAS